MVNGWLRWQAAVRKNPGLCPVRGGRDRKTDHGCPLGRRPSTQQIAIKIALEVFDITACARGRIRCGGRQDVIGDRIGRRRIREHARVDVADLALPSRPFNQSALMMGDQSGLTHGD